LARQRAAARGDAAATTAAAPPKARLTIGKARVDASARVVACRQCSAAHLDALADFAQLRALRIDAPRPDALRAGRSKPRALEQVRYLVLYAQSGKGVGQILKRFPNLRGLWLVTKATPAADLAVLADLRKLRRLNLSATAESGPLPVLSKLTELEELLVLAQGDADTLSPLLANPPPGLRRLSVHNAPPQLDLSRLARLVELKVTCRRNGRFDLGGVARLPHLRTLSVIGCALDPAEPLEGARALERLELAHASPRVAAAAFSLERLRVLQIDIRGPEHAQAPPPSLRQLKRLRVLELRAAMTDLSFLGSHPHLQILRLSSVSLRRLDGIERLPALTSLHVDPGEHLSDLSALSQLTRLQRLTVTAPSSVADLGALRNLRRLESVTIECPPAADLSPLTGLARLQYLDLSGDSPFGGLCLDFDARGHRDLSPLLSTRRLTHLSLDAREPGAERLARALVGISGFACGETPECEDLFESAPAREGGKPRP
ncbi:MAG: hypothetical protein OXT09_31910, partial [Myxococcales bacterium]|nr:hypothetical protein [Myxococcales bacterium]